MLQTIIDKSQVICFVLQRLCLLHSIFNTVIFCDFKGSRFESSNQWQSHDPLIGMYPTQMEYSNVKIQSFKQSGTENNRAAVFWPGGINGLAGISAREYW